MFVCLFVLFPRDLFIMPYTDSMLGEIIYVLKM